MIYFTLVLFLLVIASVVKFKYDLDEIRKQHAAELRMEITKARKDGKQRSAAVQWGKSIEHFVPFMSEFPIPVEDITFLGMPIDYVGFTNTDSKTECEVHFVEVKSGKSILASKQRNIRDAVKAGRVVWHEISVDGNFEK